MLNTAHASNIKKILNINLIFYLFPKHLDEMPRQELYIDAGLPDEPDYHRHTPLIFPPGCSGQICIQATQTARHPYSQLLGILSIYPHSEHIDNVSSSFICRCSPILKWFILSRQLSGRHPKLQPVQCRGGLAIQETEISKANGPQTSTFSPK